MAYKISKVRAFDKKVADAPGEMAKALAPITAGRLNLLGVWGWTEGKSATIRICMQRVTPKQLSIISEAGFTEVPGTVVSIQCDNKPGVAQTIGAATGEADASMEAFTGLAIGKQGATLAFFDDDNAADKAIKAVKGSEKKVSSAKKKTVKKKSAAKKTAAKKKAAAKKTTTKKTAKKTAAKKKPTTKKSAATKTAAKKKATAKKKTPKKKTAAKKKATAKKKTPKKKTAAKKKTTKKKTSKKKK